MKLKIFFMRNWVTKSGLITILSFSLVLPGLAQKNKSPNIVIIYVDDLGYGDVGCYGATEVKTPNIDRLAKNGLRFTDGHCTAATCTPSRFSLLTGSYAFRNKAAILPGDAPLLIHPGTATLPGILKKAGYTTAVIGKWHLGLGNGNINWNSDISPGPLEIGFDHSFIIPATLDRVPCVFVDGHRVANLDPADPIFVSYGKKIGNEPTGIERPDLLKMKADTQHSKTIINGISRIGYMSGGRSAWWKDEEIPFVLLERTGHFLTENKDKPFFLYLSYTDIHVPRAPNEKFINSTNMGRRGDVIAQMDWLTGEVMRKLEQLNLAKNTLVIFTSDNGPVLDDGYADEAQERVGKHKPSGPFRGGKYSAFEAGTRVPTIVHWPARVRPGISRALVSQVDLFASLASLAGQSPDSCDAPDSYNMLGAWLGKDAIGRNEMLEESYSFSLRQGNWKYIAPQKNSAPAWMANKKLETGFLPAPQLYDLSKDPGEKKNLATVYPQKLKQMQDALDRIMQSGTRAGFCKQKK